MSSAERRSVFYVTEKASVFLTGLSHVFCKILLELTPLCAGGMQGLA
jgi:hypothetical protein